MENPDQMGYDQAIVVFSPDGRMYQIEYARKAVETSPTVVGIKYSDGVVIAAAKYLTKLMVPESIVKVSKIDEHIILGTCGILSDSRVLADYARVTSQINRITYNEPIEPIALVKDICDRLQGFTQIGGSRPFGVSMLIAGRDDDKISLYETDPSGTFREWKAHVIGKGSKKGKEFIEKNYKIGLKKEKAIELAIETLKKCEDNVSKDKIDIGIIEMDKMEINSKNLFSK